ncbi:hypothetical protein Tco_0984809, partial [Tanacetum coccineum]
TDNQEKNEKQSQNNKTGLGMEKTVKDKAKSKPESEGTRSIIQALNSPEGEQLSLEKEAPYCLKDKTLNCNEAGKEACCDKILNCEDYFQVCYGATLIFFFIGLGSSVVECEIYDGILKRLDWVDFLATTFNSFCISTRFWDCNAVFDCDDDAISQSLISWGWSSSMNIMNMKISLNFLHQVWFYKGIDQVAICLAWTLSFSSIVADRSYEHDNGFVFADISIGADIQMYVGISSWGENLWRVVCADISKYADISSWAL